MKCHRCHSVQALVSPPLLLLLPLPSAFPAEAFPNILCFYLPFYKTWGITLTWHSSVASTNMQHGHGYCSGYYGYSSFISAFTSGDPWEGELINTIVNNSMSKDPREQLRMEHKGLSSEPGGPQSPPVHDNCVEPSLTLKTTANTAEGTLKPIPDLRALSTPISGTWPWPGKCDQGAYGIFWSRGFYFDRACRMNSYPMPVPPLVQRVTERSLWTVKSYGARQHTLVCSILISSTNFFLWSCFFTVTVYWCHISSQTSDQIW